jgi:spore photoproduct lyase
MSMTNPVIQHSYQQKFEQIVPQTQFGLLPDSEQVFLKQKACEMRFTQQELRLVSEMALDRTRWKETPLSRAWPAEGRNCDSVLLKKRLLSRLRENQENLRGKANEYSKFSPEDKPRTLKPILKTTVQPGLGLGRCPVASERTRCCNLLTLDAVEKCGFDCSYCSIQSFYHGNEVKFDSGFADKLAKLKLDPGKTYHIGTGQSSDSLMWGNHQGVLEALCEFAQRHPNVILELKTKSKNIGWLLKNPVPPNVICTWSLNPQSIIDHEEHLSASLKQRLESAKALADKGCVVGFHLHPIIHYSDWENDYLEICQQLISNFEPGQVAMVSMGTLTFTKSVMKTIRQRDLTSKILQMPMEQVAGKFSYPAEIKLQLFKHVYSELSSWHRKVFFYLCMEPQDFWNPVFGFDYENNDAFEAAMKSAYFSKINNIST